jgi:cytochrome P450
MSHHPFNIDPIEAAYFSMPMPATEVSADHRPPYWDAQQRVWIVTQYRDACTLLRHPLVAVAEICPGLERLEQRSGRQFPHLKNLLNGMSIFHNPPQHSRSRAFLKQAMTAIARMITANSVEELAKQLGDALEARSECDAIRDLCERFPNLVMGEALNFAEHDIATIRSAFEQLCVAWQPGIPLRVYSVLEDEAARVEAFLTQKIGCGISARPKAAALLWDLNAGGFGYSDAELVSLVFFMITAGVENATGLLGNALLILLTFPDLVPLLRRRPELIGGFVDESIRYLGPVRRLGQRYAREDIPLEHVTLSKDTRILFDLDRIHRDPSAFSDPGRFDPARNGPPHLGFSTGAHACLGASLARLEARCLFSMLLDRFELALAAPEPVWKPNPDLRFLSCLRVGIRLR